MSKIVSLFVLTAGYLPAVLVLGGLGWLAHWGHQSGWKLPRYADLAGQAEEAEKEDWCAEHNVPESRCILCHPELVGEKMDDWCKEHGIAESKCTLCHPELLNGGVAADWCPEHGIAESNCTLCHPEIATKGTLPADAQEVKVVSSVGGFHSMPKVPAAISKAPENVTVKPTKPDPKKCQTHLMKVQFASGDAVKKAGVRLAQVSEAPIDATVKANAETAYDQRQVVRVSSRVPGVIWQIRKELGSPVMKGEVLAVIDSEEVGRLKSDFLGAAGAVAVEGRNVQRLQPAAKEALIPMKELRDAEGKLFEARMKFHGAHQALLNLGFHLNFDELNELNDAELAKKIRLSGLPDEVTKSLDPNVATSNLLPILSPADGVIVERNVVAGEVVEKSEPMFVVANVTQMWVMADMMLEDSRLVTLGQAVTFRPDSAADEAISGKVTWIGTEIDEKSRTRKLRAEVENAQSRLPAHSFGTAYITVRSEAKAIVVPGDAIHWEGCCYVVFVRLTDDIFQTRKVKLGTKLGPLTEVLIGVMPGEIVATQGSHVLKSEILKSKLGAGCTCVE